MNLRLSWRRSWRQIIGGVAALVTAVVLIGGSLIGGGEAAHAAPASSSAATMPLYGTPHETGKVTLPEWSLDAPALWTTGAPSAPAGPLMVLAWTGTDGRLNYEFGNGGIHSFISGSKRILAETSFVRPAVVRGMGEGGFTAPVALAWTGTDSGHHLNVLYRLPSGTTQKLTLWNDTSFTSPSLEWLSVNTQGGTLLLAWTGTDAGHSLNTVQVRVTSQGLVQGPKTTFWNYHSAGQPELIQSRTFGGPSVYFLGWTDATSHRILWASSPDGKVWTQRPAFPEWSGSAPSLMGLNEQLAHHPPFWMAWAGTGADTAHHVNVLYAPSYTQATTNFVKATLPETALGGPAIGFNIYLPGQELVVAWTGTDRLHHVNLATLGV